MWVLENHTPFAAERSWVRDKNGAEVWLVAVRGTFSIFPDGTVEIAEKQGDVCMAPEYCGEPGKSSLLYESDLFHTKPQTDVILHGHAYAPGGKYATQVDVAIKVGNISKSLRVFGDRYWEKGFLGMKMTRPKPFGKMPIVYERAFGGWDQKSDNPKKHSWEPRNPIGTGFAVEAKHLEGQKLPNVEYPKSLISSWKQRPSPAGFGPVAGNWQPRLQLAGTYDKKWEEERLPLLPDDFDERYYQCSPPDQQVPGYLHGGELAELFNLTPHGYLKFRLPIVKLHFDTHFGSEFISHTANLHTVIIEPDHPRLIMVWHTMLPCHFKVLKLETTTVTDREISMPCCQ
ncbi:MAG: DUF2169 domain-containing protein [Thermodesulfobacteriota bacterium]|nr:DUF2169 domain-containing protein [Thermodesulfobacteriota bacterium]